MIHPPTLVLLAAGKSMRFGRPKQLEPVGPNGEAIMDFTLRDAFAAGCVDAHIVVRPEHEELFRVRFKKEKRVRILVQAEALGTGHAAMIGMEHVADTAIVANGDDYYGAGSIRMAVEHAREGFPEESALVAFELGNTLSANGPVNRAVCSTDEYHLLGTEEVVGLERKVDGSIRDRFDHGWRDNVLVSMNLWVFRDLFDISMYCSVRDRDANEPVEIGLPALVIDALKHEQMFRVLRTTDSWCGLTFPADADLVRRTLASIR